MPLMGILNLDIKNSKKEGEAKENIANSWFLKLKSKIESKEGEGADPMFLKKKNHPCRSNNHKTLSGSWRTLTLSLRRVNTSYYILSKTFHVSVIRSVFN